MSHIKKMAPNTAKTRETIVSITWAPIRSNETRFEFDAAFCFSRRVEILVFIAVVYTEKVNNLGRRS